MKDPLADLMKIEGVTDIFVNGPKSVNIDRGRGIEKVIVEYDGLSTASQIRALAQSYAFAANERLDDGSPIVDAKLPNGVRLAAVLSPICPKEVGALISLRIPSKSVWKLNELEEMGMITKQITKDLKAAISSKKNIMISGATGSGKTTLLSALIHEIADNERIVCIEEAREIHDNLHPNLVFLTAKKANAEGCGAVGLRELLKSSLRMRPDRIIVGECRGGEVEQYLQILNTGHNGTICTIHANSVDDIDKRLAQLAGIDDNSHLFKNIDVKVHVNRDRGSQRKVVQLWTK